jgi:DNA-binding transcriptional MerR regulator
MGMVRMTIKEAGKKFSLSSYTLRYYEKVGLIPEIDRNKGGIRDYTDDDCKRIQFVKCMRDAGIPIEVLTEYMTLSNRDKAGLEAGKKLLIEQRERIVKRIREMQDAVVILDGLI